MAGWLQTTLPHREPFAFLSRKDSTKLIPASPSLTLRSNQYLLDDFNIALNLYNPPSLDSVEAGVENSLPQSKASSRVSVNDNSKILQKATSESILLEKQVLSDQMVLTRGYKELIAKRVAMAQQAGHFQKNPGMQVRMLMSAFADAEGLIGGILADFSGMQLPPDAVAMISSMRALQAQILTQIRQVTGLELTDDELRAVLEKAPKKSSSTNIVLNEDQSREKGSAASRSNDPATDVQRDQLAEKSNIALDSTATYGIRANPKKWENALASGGEKASRQIGQLASQVSRMLNAFEQDPAGTLGSLGEIISLINRGALMCGALQGLEGINKDFAAARNSFDDARSRLQKAIAKQGLPQNALIDISQTAPVTSVAS